MICAECRFEADCETLKNIPGLRGCGHGEPKLIKETGAPPIPKGYKEIEDVDGVFVSDGEIVVTGQPKEDDENHDCNVMGCSSVSHVLFRARIGGTQ